MAADDVYRKIEKRVLGLKEKEEFWKKRHGELAQQLKELAESRSKQAEKTEQSIGELEERIEALRKAAKKNSEKAEETFRLMDRKISGVSDSAKSLSEKVESRGAETGRIKEEVVSHAKRVIADYEATFEKTAAKINAALEKMERETKKAQELYEKVEAAKRFLESYRPPEPRFSPAPPAPVSPDVSRQLLPPPPAPERFAAFPSIPFAPEQEPFPAAERTILRRRIRRPEPDDLDDLDDADDDMDVDDIIPGRMRGLGNSVRAMNANVDSISEKLASIEGAVAKVHGQRNPDIDRMEDKIRMYNESVEGMRSRMEAVERALKNGMTPMMDSMKALVDAVKTLKEEQAGSRIQPVRKPTPPKVFLKAGSQRLDAGEESILAPSFSVPGRQRKWPK